MSRLNHKRASASLPDVDYRNFIFADAVTIIITANALEEVCTPASRSVRFLREALVELSRLLRTETCKNIVCSPSLLPRGIFRLSTQLRSQTTKRNTAKRRNMILVFLIFPLGPILFPVMMIHPHILIPRHQRSHY